MPKPFHIVSVVSNKGGVGKSMIAANLALALQAQGIKVGLLDADLDSPYLVEVVGATGHIELDDDRKMIPVQCRGMPIMSFALWVPRQFTGASMPGQMHELWITDALQHTDWGDLDLLIVDLPAGLGDEYLTVTRIDRNRYLGAIVVALPNVQSGLRRVYETASYHHLRILGVIENMAGPIFGVGITKQTCQELGLNFLGSIPLDSRIRQNLETHEPRLPADFMGPILAAQERIQQTLVSA